MLSTELALHDTLDMRLDSGESVRQCAVLRANSLLQVVMGRYANGELLTYAALDEQDVIMPLLLFQVFLTLGVSWYCRVFAPIKSGTPRPSQRDVSWFAIMLSYPVAAQRLTQQRTCTHHSIAVWRWMLWMCLGCKRQWEATSHRRWLAFVSGRSL